MRAALAAGTNAARGVTCLGEQPDDLARARGREAPIMGPRPLAPQSTAGGTMMIDSQKMLQFDSRRTLTFDFRRALSFSPNREMLFNSKRKLGFDQSRDLGFGKRGPVFRGLVCPKCQTLVMIIEENCPACNTKVQDLSVRTMGMTSQTAQGMTPRVAMQSRQTAAQGAPVYPQSQPPRPAPMAQPPPRAAQPQPPRQAQVQRPASMQPPSQVVCPNCALQLQTQTVYCPRCGVNIQQWRQYLTQMSQMRQGPDYYRGQRPPGR